MKPPLLIVLGPTSTGKSDLAIFLAQHLHGEIVSADSRQVYKGMDIGTGKITEKEMCGIPHHLLSYIDPNKHYSVVDWHKDALACIEDITARGKLPIVCGGTGFYIQSIVDNTTLPEVPPNRALRARLEALSPDALFERLSLLDNNRAQTIDRYNKVRLIRAIEIATAHGSVPHKEPKESDYTIYQVGLITDKDTLMHRVHNRLKKRLEAGMVKEVETLHESGVSWDRLISFGLEYKYCTLHLLGQLTSAELLEELLIKTWQYAKRQITWFKRDQKIHWYSPEDKEKVLADIHHALFDSRKQ